MRALVVAFGAATVFAVEPAAFAQSDNPTDNDDSISAESRLDTVIVTAGRREQSIVEIARTAIVVDAVEVEKFLAT